jgi:ribulose kinase
MAAEIGPAGAVVAAGGWTRMKSVRLSKAASMPNVRFSNRAQAGAFGATMFAAHAAIVAENLATTGASSANSVLAPNGPSAEFAARYTQAVPVAASAARTFEEITT